MYIYFFITLIDIYVVEKPHKLKPNNAPFIAYKVYRKIRPSFMCAFFISIKKNRMYTRVLNVSYIIMISIIIPSKALNHARG